MAHTMMIELTKIYIFQKSDNSCSKNLKSLGFPNYPESSQNLIKQILHL